MSSQYLIPELSPYAYIGLPGDVVETLAPHTESAKEALLLTTLAMFGNAVGFALAEKMLSARFNRDGHGVICVRPRGVEGDAYC